MVKQFKSPQGYTVLKMSLFECTSIFKGGAGICDNCGLAVLEGYYVPVLNHYLCPKCYQDFTQRTPYYPEDAHFESYWLDYVSKRIKNSAFPYNKRRQNNVKQSIYLDGHQAGD